MEPASSVLVSQFIGLHHEWKQIVLFALAKCEGKYDFTNSGHLFFFSRQWGYSLRLRLCHQLCSFITASVLQSCLALMACSFWVSPWMLRRSDWFWSIFPLSCLTILSLMIIGEGCLGMLALVSLCAQRRAVVILMNRSLGCCSKVTVQAQKQLVCNLSCVRETRNCLL